MSKTLESKLSGKKKFKVLWEVARREVLRWGIEVDFYSETSPMGHFCSG
jgi:hypothetical protein